jgi:tRNA(adenine34) deaminase
VAIEPARDDEFMALALSEARAAAAHGDVPIGCVVVVDDLVVAQGENRREVDADPTAHAEIVALRRAAAARGRWRLEDATVFVTLEPCVMCAGALLNARVARLVIGAQDDKAGAVGSRYHVLADPRLLHEVSVTYDVRANESAALLGEFFRERRPSHS